MKKITCSHDTDVPVEEWPVRPYSKSELARAYAPEIGERSALTEGVEKGGIESDTCEV